MTALGTVSLVALGKNTNKQTQKLSKRPLKEPSSLKIFHAVWEPFSFAAVGNKRQVANLKQNTDWHLRRSAKQ
jgi:hypothetical protein